jgi:hypothetical protein
LLNSAAQGGAIACYRGPRRSYPTDASAIYGGQNRVFHEWPNTQRGTVGPYLPTSQIVCVWYGANDLGGDRAGGPAWPRSRRRCGRSSPAACRGGVREQHDVSSCRRHACTFTGTWTRNAGASARVGARTRHDVAYPTNKVTLQVPPDYGTGRDPVQCVELTGGRRRVWDLVDVTAGGSTTLFTGWDTRNLGAEEPRVGYQSQERSRRASARRSARRRRRRSLPT